MTDKVWTMQEVRALTPAQVQQLTHDDFVAVLRLAQQEGADGPGELASVPVHPLPEGASRVLFDPPPPDAARPGRCAEAGT